jgi:hypothetical protein
MLLAEKRMSRTASRSNIFIRLASCYEREDLLQSGRCDGTGTPGSTRDNFSSRVKQLARIVAERPFRIALGIAQDSKSERRRL